MLLSDQPKINLALGVHNHQPFGNWDWVIEEAFLKAYLPFLEVLERHAGVHVTMHYSGYLLEWLLERHPDFIERLRVLVVRAQVELITGGYYAPVLAVIPDSDKIAQIRRLSEFLADRLGATSEGMWLAERVWEPHLVKPISEAGVRWTALDDTIFSAAGLRGPALFGYYLSEEQGRTLEVLPINSELSRLIPFAAPERIVEYLRANASADGNRLALCLDDGEKLGIWPNTHKALYEAGWLDRFFSLLEEHRDWIRSVTVQEYRSARCPFGRIYLPSGSYTKIQEWALPPEEAATYSQAILEVPERFGNFLRGGMWRNFLVRYPESNNLHKKMLRVSQSLQDLPAGPQRDEAMRGLWQGQSNDPYWHGIFGGLYLSHLRSANYRALIGAEVLSDRHRHGDESFLEIEERDFDCDGKREVLVSTSVQNLYFNREGGSLFELDYKPIPFNLLDTLARRPEAYHGKIARAATLESFNREGSLKAIYDVVLTKEAGLERFLFNDWYRRLSYIDHFLHPDSHLESFYNMSFGEQGDFVNQEYQVAIAREAASAVVTFKREGHVWVGSEFWDITLEKAFRFTRGHDARVEVDYTLTNGKDRPVTLWFGIEFNTNFLAGNAPDRYYASPGTLIADPRLGSRGELKAISELSLRDAYNGLEYALEWNVPATLWRFPVETISMSEGGVERVYQSSVVMPHWRLELGAHQSVKLRLAQQIRRLAPSPTEAGPEARAIMLD